MKRSLTVEWAEAPNLWRRQTVEYTPTIHQDNFKFMFNDTLHIFQNFKEGTPILKLDDKKWVKVGRISVGCVFLGKGISYAEFCRTPEGVKVAEELMRSLRNKLQPIEAPIQTR